MTMLQASILKSKTLKNPSASLKSKKEVATKREVHQYPPGSMLQNHQQEYFKNSKKLEQDFNNIYEIVNINSKLKSHRMPCIKYNYSLDEETCDFTCYDSII